MNKKVFGASVLVIGIAWLCAIIFTAISPMQITMLAILLVVLSFVVLAILATIK
ncbi:hypothetical protein [Microbulbifer guangxiensis]|uniref:hypothetical protein n=1 Tax=Microbulbifer guangxiensis TaxID=2904249 RepID=UPI001F199E9B|nr:hypothetical protein [Microbulbifer guangxiensis]